MLYLGLDAGATKSKAVLLSDHFNPVAESETPGANASAIGIENALRNVESAILNVTKSIKNMEIKSCLAIAGVDSNKSKEIWQEAIRSSKKLQPILIDPIIVNDTRAAIRTATKSKNAIVIVAGTGSNCWGTNNLGNEAKTSGVGHILSDQGSAYDIGLKILKAVYKDIDGRGPQTQLTTLFKNGFNINSGEELVDLVYQNYWQKPDIAYVATLIEQAANENDNVALKILEESVSEITLMIETVVKKLGLENKEYDLVTTGSVFNIKKLFKEEVENRIKKFSPKVSFPKQIIDSATAAAHLAAEA